MGSLGERRDCLPIIDISSIDSQTGDRLIQAASKWGFFYVRNQDLGFTPKTMDRSFDLVDGTNHHNTLWLTDLNIVAYFLQIA